MYNPFHSKLLVKKVFALLNSRVQTSRCTMCKSRWWNSCFRFCMSWRDAKGRRVQHSTMQSKVSYLHHMPHRLAVQALGCNRQGGFKWFSLSNCLENKIIINIIIDPHHPLGEHRASTSKPSSAHESLLMPWLSPRSSPLFPTPAAWTASSWKEWATPGREPRH